MSGAALQPGLRLADEMGAVPATGALAQYDLDGDGIVYQDGMHPQIVQDEPGLCPICNMELTPVPVGRYPATPPRERHAKRPQTVGGGAGEGLRCD